MLKYEARYRTCYTTQFFLVASSKDKFLDSVQGLLQTLDLPQRHKLDPNVRIQALHDWLFQTSHWLLLIDNIGLETVELVRELLATDAQGHVIFTSQSKGAVEKITGSSKACLELRELSLNEATEMFFAEADINPDVSTRQVGAEVVSAMGLMPHAIEQAASYVKVNGVEPQAFLVRYKEAPEQVSPSRVE
jgi:hypothetical protein